MLKCVKFFIFFLFIGFIIDFSNSQCVKTVECKCIKKDGWGYDLGSFKNSEPLKSKDGNVTFQPCKDADLNFPNTTVKGCNSASLCLKNNDTSLNLGTFEQTHWAIMSGRSNLRLTLTNEQKRGTFIDLICCHEPCETVLDASQLNTTNIVTLTSSRVCQKNIEHKSNLSTGSILLILLFVMVGLYLVIGALALKYFQGAVGWELIPNYDFWSSLPGLVRDGVTYTMSGCSTNSYEQI